MFAIQIRSRTSASIAFSSEERNQIEKELGDAFPVNWLPPVLRSREGNDAGNSDHSTILIFVLGMTLSSVIKPFVEEISKEIAKDFWANVKRLYAKLIHKQKAKSYRVSTRAYLFFELNDEFVAVELPAMGGAELTEAEFVAIIETELARLLEDWDNIVADVEHFEIGKLQPNHRDIATIHLIVRRGGSHYTIIPSSWEDLHMGD